MKRYIAVVVLLTGLGALGAHSSAAAPPDSAFEKFKALAGQWEGPGPDGQPARATYRVTSGGSVVIETLEHGDEPAMITVYHRDGSDLRMTHFCSAQNQPRMKAADPGEGARTISFQFVDATNVSGSHPGHMRALTVTFKDKDHITQVWTWQHENGKRMDSLFQFARVE